MFVTQVRKLFRSGRTLQFYLANNDNVTDTANVKIMSIKQ